MEVGADRARLEASEQMLRLRFENYSMPNQIECLLFGRAAPADLSRAVFGFGDCVESVLPLSSRHARIRPHEICLGDLEIQLRLPGGFVTRMQK